MQQCFGLFSFSKSPCFLEILYRHHGNLFIQFLYCLQKQSSSNFCEKLFPNFLSFVHFICSSLVLYVEMATSLPVKSWCEYFASIQHSLFVVILITRCRVEFAPASKQNKPLSPICIRLHYVHEGIFSAAHYFFLTCRLH